METIILRTKKELEIYMNPVRQEILHEMQRAGVPVTPKYLSNALGISASSIQFHIKKLESIGVVALDHTEQIRGICARFFHLTDAMISLGSGTELQKERDLILENDVRSILERCLKTFHEHVPECKNEEQLLEASYLHGNILTGIAFLSDEDAALLMNQIYDFLKEHSTKEVNTKPWEYALITHKL